MDFDPDGVAGRVWWLTCEGTAYAKMCSQNKTQDLGIEPRSFDPARAEYFQAISTTSVSKQKT